MGDLFGNGKIDLQKEMDNFILGSDYEESKGKDLIFRRMRRDSSGDLIRCVCVNDNTDEPDRDSYCPYCLGAKYYWDEEFVKAYWHRENEDTLTFYFRHSVEPSSVDELITVKMNDDGTLVSPIERIELYNILSTGKLREERAVLVYYKIIAAPVNRRYIGPQNGGR